MNYLKEKLNLTKMKYIKKHQTSNDDPVEIDKKFYSLLTMNQLMKLYSIFKWDFLLFDYDIFPYDTYVKKQNYTISQ